MPNLSNTWSRSAAPAALAALALAASASPARACSCIGSAEVEVALAGADVVFEGTPRQSVALQADLYDLGYTGARRVDFEVVRYFKGQLGPSLSIFTIDQSSACGREYSQEPYFVYARYTESGYLSDNVCSSSVPTRLASRDRERLGAGTAPDPTLPNEWLGVDDESSGAIGDGDARDPRGGTSDESERPSVSSGVNRVPLDAGDGPRGCASLAPQPSSSSRVLTSPGWFMLLLGGIARARRWRRRAPAIR